MSKMERQGCKHMNHLSKKVLPGAILLLAILISACSFTVNPTTTNLPLATSTTFTGPVCNSASYISDVTIPDHATVAAGQTFVKTWMVQNTGTCTWNANYTLTFVGGSQMGGTNTSVGGSVVPGQQAKLSVTLNAPTAAGQYTGYWELANDSGETFGEQVNVLINIAGPAVVPIATLAPTSTLALIATLAPTATLASTATLAPTNTLAPTATLKP
jgi:hypothetical protein